MQTRTSYDTSIKHLYRLGLEAAIPPTLRKQIPRSTIHRWRHEKDAKYVGFELNKLASSELELLKQFATNQSAKRIFMSYVRIGRFIQSIAGEKTVRKLFKKNKEGLIDMIERAKEGMPMNQVLRCLKISRSTYNVWVQSFFGDCAISPMNLCKVRHPNQLKADEVETIKELLTDEKIEHWSISDIAHYARREGLLYLSQSTWYKYANLLGLRRKQARHRKPRRRKGIRAKAPNELWHADVTYFRIGTKVYYIYLVIDNFSRKVLSYLVSDKLSARNRLKTVTEAYENEHGILYNDMRLMVDGGSENNNKIMSEFLAMNPNLSKKVAFKDIAYSNNQIESHNAQLKRLYLYREKIHTSKKLKAVVSHAIHEFNNIKPYSALDGMTPAEAHELLPHYADNQQVKWEMKEARLSRCDANKCSSCENCPFVKDKVPLVIDSM